MTGSPVKLFRDCRVAGFPCLFDKYHLKKGESAMGTIVRGTYMEVVRQRMNSNLIAEIIALPASFLNKEVEVIVKESAKEESIVDQLCGIASNLNMTADEVRSERLRKYEVTD